MMHNNSSCPECKKDLKQLDKRLHYYNDIVTHSKHGCIIDVNGKQEVREYLYHVIEYKPNMEHIEDKTLYQKNT